MESSLKDVMASICFLLPKLFNKHSTENIESRASQSVSLHFSTLHTLQFFFSCFSEVYIV